MFFFAHGLCFKAWGRKPQVACGVQQGSQGRRTELGLSLQSLIVPGKSPTRKKPGPFGSRRSSAIGIENIQEVQEKRWVEQGGVAGHSGQEGGHTPFWPLSPTSDCCTVRLPLCARHQGQLIT